MFFPLLFLLNAICNIPASKIIFRVLTSRGSQYVAVDTLRTKKVLHFEALYNHKLC